MMRVEHWLLVAAVGAAHGEADACVCPDLGYSSPAQAASDVPTNLRLLAFSNATGTATYGLRAKGGASVAIGEVVVENANGRLAQIPVLETLQPQTAYELVEQLGQVSDVRLAFVTGTAADEVAPAPATVDGLGLERIEVATNTCMTSSTGVAVRGSVSHSEDTVGVVIRFTSGDFVQERLLPPGTDALRRLGNGSCDIKVAFDSDSYDIEVFARDLAGNVSASSSYQAEVVGGDCSATSTPANMAWLFVAIPLIARRRRGSSSAR